MENILRQMAQGGNFKIIAKTFYGLEDILIREIEEIGGVNIEKLNRAVAYEGNLDIVYKSNILLRTALRVLIPFKEFRANNPKKLYHEARGIDWSKMFSVTETFAVDSFVGSKYFKHTKYPALVTKDAIVDQFRENHKSRPSVDVQNPTVRINLHISDDKCTLSLDSSGESLHKRGYRKDKNEAPMNEVLAAGLVLLSGWDKKTTFVDPMCGSGTIAIEAGLIANNVAPGTLRSNYGFMNWKNFNKEKYSELIAETKKSILNSLTEIYASDIQPKNILIAKNNASNAGLHYNIEFKIKDFFKFRGFPKKAFIITNPPYGQRLKEKDIIEFYKKIGDTLKTNFTGSEAWIFSGNKDALKHLGLHPSEKITLYNGPIESKFYKYSLYEGSAPPEEKTK